MLDKDKYKLETLREIKATFGSIKTARGFEGDFTDALAIDGIQRVKKQLTEAKEIAEANNFVGRLEAANKSLAVLNEYLPPEISAEELEVVVSDCVTAVNEKNIGKVINLAKAELAARGYTVNNKVLADLVKQQLL